MGEAARKAHAVQVGTVSACANCRFYRKPRADMKAGVCQRNPPTVHVLGLRETPLGQQPALVTLWPEVADGTWCGEWGPVVPTVDFSQLDVVEGVG